MVPTTYEEWSTFVDALNVEQRRVLRTALYTAKEVPGTTWQPAEHLMKDFSDDSLAFGYQHYTGAGPIASAEAVRRMHND